MLIFVTARLIAFAAPSDTGQPRGYLLTSISRTSPRSQSTVFLGNPTERCQ